MCVCACVRAYVCKRCETNLFYGSNKVLSETAICAAYAIWHAFTTISMQNTILQLNLYVNCLDHIQEVSEIRTVKYNPCVWNECLPLPYFISNSINPTCKSKSCITDTFIYKQNGSLLQCREIPSLNVVGKKSPTLSLKCTQLRKILRLSARNVIFLWIWARAHQKWSNFVHTEIRKQRTL